ncbi:hypothetical protein B0H14DRAFT_2862422 [Mycena olivaceomarginata]|nr:hypothetical protein B0H14DRAFT_2862422 [Mycena olivaceomarginata]
MDLISFLILFLSLLASPFHSFVLIPLLIPLSKSKYPPSVEVRPVPHVAFESRASSTLQPIIPAHCDRISFCSHTRSFMLILQLLTYIFHFLQTLYFTSYVLPTRRAEPELGHLGLRRGSIPKWSGHPHSALSGAANISLYVFA